MSDEADGTGEADAGDRRETVDDDAPVADDGGPVAEGDGSGDHPIPPEEWRVIVDRVPLVSVDLLVRREGGLLVGKRTNEPAKGEWFVPGGTVLKGERLEDAVRRVAREELGVDVDVVRRLGTYEHFYDRSDVAGVDGKHYLATAFVVRPRGSVESAPGDDGPAPGDDSPASGGDPPASWDDLFALGDDQHSAFRTVDRDDGSVHPYVSRYLRDLGLDGGIED